MALVQFGDIITGMRGSVGGATYGNSRAGFTKRNKPIPVQPVSAARGQAKSTLAYWQGQWRQLMESQRIAWNAAAINFPRVNSLGITYYLTGINLFSAFNINLDVHGLDPIYDPPSPFSFPSFVPSVTGNSVGATEMFVESTPWLDSDWLLSIEAMRGQSQGVSSPRGQWFLIAWLFDYVTHPNNIYGRYVGKIGQPIIGSKVFLRFTPMAIASGQMGVSQVISFTVEA